MTGSAIGTIRRGAYLVLPGVVAALVIAGCASASHPLRLAERNDAAVYRAIIEYLAEQDPPDEVRVARGLVLDPNRKCDAHWYKFHDEALGGAAAEAMKVLCAAEPGGSLAPAAIREATASWPTKVFLRSEHRELRLAFSAVAYSRDRSEAVVYVEHDQRGEYWLLKLSLSEGWTVLRYSLSWIA